MSLCSQRDLFQQHSLVKNNPTCATACKRRRKKSSAHTTLSIHIMAGKKIRCGAKDCREPAQRIVGDCGFCNGHFCGKHRLLEDHKCSGLEDVSGHGGLLSACITSGLRWLTCCSAKSSHTRATPHNWRRNERRSSVAFKWGTGRTATLHAAESGLTVGRTSPVSSRMPKRADSRPYDDMINLSFLSPLHFISFFDWSDCRRQAWY